MQATRTLNHKLWDERYGTHFFQVGHTIYFLDSKALARSSALLRNLVEAEWGEKQGIKGSGCVQNDPIKIPDIGEAEFEVFALRAYSTYVDLPGYPDIAPFFRKLLNLGDYFLSSSTLRYAFQEVERNHYRFSPSELISFCYRYHTRKFAAKAFDRLILDPFSEITVEDARLLGIEALLILVKTKENLHLHLHNIACNPPELTHADDCLENISCEDDWRAVWWNIMGRNLLDAKNALSWGEAVKRFRKAEFGCMGTQCREDILTKIMLGNGYFRGQEIRNDAMQKLLTFMPEIDPEDSEDN